MKKRLSKILAENNIASRRKAEELIFDKKVKVNNTLVTKPQFLADIETDRIEVNGKILKPLSKKIYYIINKPKGYVCSCKRITNEKIILDLFPTEKRLFPVGRLDKDTTGLLIITNDGHFAQKIIHPSFDIEKEYLVKVNKFITHDDLVLLSKGIYIDKTFTKPTKVIKVRKNTLKITVKEGKKHEIRILCEKNDLEILELKRIRLGPLVLGNLEIGQYRFMNKKELNQFDTISK